MKPFSVPDGFEGGVKGEIEVSSKGSYRGMIWRDREYEPGTGQDPASPILKLFIKSRVACKSSL